MLMVNHYFSGFCSSLLLLLARAFLLLVATRALQLQLRQQGSSSRLSCLVSSLSLSEYILECTFLVYVFDVLRIEVLKYE